MYLSEMTFLKIGYKDTKRSLICTDMSSDHLRNDCNNFSVDGGLVYPEKMDGTLRA